MAGALTKLSVAREELASPGERPLTSAWSNSTSALEKDRHRPVWPRVIGPETAANRTSERRMPPSRGRLRLCKGREVSSDARRSPRLERLSAAAIYPSIAASPSVLPPAFLHRSRRQLSPFDCRSPGRYSRKDRYLLRSESINLMPIVRASIPSMPTDRQCGNYP